MLRYAHQCYTTICIVCEALTYVMSVCYTSHTIITIICMFSEAHLQLYYVCYLYLAGAWNVILWMHLPPVMHQWDSNIICYFVWSCFQIENKRLSWNSESKIRSLEKASHKPAGGDVKVSLLSTTPLPHPLLLLLRSHCPTCTCMSYVIFSQKHGISLHWVSIP